MTDTNNKLNDGPPSRNQGRNPGTISSGLLQDVQNDGAEAWTRLTSLYAPLVCYWCLRQGLQSTDAEDVVQEVFRTVAARVDGFRRDRGRGSFRGWLRTITRHKLGDFFRARKQQANPTGGSVAYQRLAEVPDEETGDVDTSESLSAETRLLHARVLELIRAEFEERTWQASLRVIVDGAAPKDVADELGMSVNSVYLAKSRVLRRVRDELRDALG